jgi:hypothetical protein
MRHMLFDRSRPQSVSLTCTASWLTEAGGGQFQSRSPNGQSPMVADDHVTPVPTPVPGVTRDAELRLCYLLAARTVLYATGSRYTSYDSLPARPNRGWKSLSQTYRHWIDRRRTDRRLSPGDGALPRSVGARRRGQSGISRVFSRLLEAGAESLVIRRDRAKATGRLGELLAFDGFGQRETSAWPQRCNGSL